MDDKQQAEQREYDDQGDRHRAPAPASLLIARLIPLRGLKTDSILVQLLCYLT